MSTSKREKKRKIKLLEQIAVVGVYKYTLAFASNNPPPPKHLNLLNVTKIKGHGSSEEGLVARGFVAH
jgi:hypothetical protein